LHGQRKKGPPALFSNLPSIGHAARQGENEAKVSFHLDTRGSNIEIRTLTLKEAMKPAPSMEEGTRNILLKLTITGLIFFGKITN